VHTYAIELPITEIALHLKISATNTVKENQCPAEVNILLKMLTLHLLAPYSFRSRKPGIQYCLIGEYHVTTSSSMASFTFLPQEYINLVSSKVRKIKTTKPKLFPVSVVYFKI